MLELVLDTSVGTMVGIVKDGEVLAEQTLLDGRHHAELLAVLLERAAAEANLPAKLAEAGFDRIIVGTGPGPFTGLRAGLVTAQALGFALQIPVLGVCTLEVLGRAGLDQVTTDARVLVVTDAKRKEVYWALYRARGVDDVECLHEPTASAPVQVAEFLSPDNKTILVGSAVDLVRAVLEAELSTSTPNASTAGQATASGDGLNAVELPTIALQLPEARVFSRIVVARSGARPGGDLSEEFAVQPLYLRRPDIHQKTA